MLISTESGGGQIVSARADTRFYDDIACLAADWVSHHEADARAFVRASSGAWSEAAGASYARSAASRTAMGSGIAAFAAAADARAADREGRVLTWDDLLAQTGESR
jgi:nitrous oxide reductase accessory protein NosL